MTSRRHHALIPRILGVRTWLSEIEQRVPLSISAEFRIWHLDCQQIFPKRVHLNAPLNHPDGVGWGTRVLPPVGWPVHVEVSPSAPLSFSWSDAAWSNWTTGLTEVFLGFIRSFNVKIPILRVFKSVIALGARAHINNSYHHRGCCWSSSSSAH